MSEKVWRLPDGALLREAPKPMTATRRQVQAKLRLELKRAVGEKIIEDFRLRPGGRATVYAPGGRSKWYTTSGLDTLALLSRLRKEAGK